MNDKTTEINIPCTTCITLATCKHKIEINCPILTKSYMSNMKIENHIYYTNIVSYHNSNIKDPWICYIKHIIYNITNYEKYLKHIFPKLQALLLKRSY